MSDQEGESAVADALVLAAKPEPASSGPWVLLRSVLSPSFPCPGPFARLVFLGLWTYADRQGQSCFPSQSRLSKDLGIGERQIRRALDQLRDAGLVIWKQVGGRFNSYSLKQVSVPALPADVPGEEGWPHSPARLAPQSGQAGPTVRPGRRGGPSRPDHVAEDPTHYRDQNRAQGTVDPEPAGPGAKPRGRTGSTRRTGNPDVTRLIRHYHEEFVRTQGVAPVIRWEVAGKAAQQLLAARGFDGVGGAAWIVSAFLGDPPEWNAKKGLLRLEDIPAAATAVLQRARQGAAASARRDSSGAPVAEAEVATEDVAEGGWWVRVTRDPRTGEVVSRRRRYPVEERSEHGEHAN